MGKQVYRDWIRTLLFFAAFVLAGMVLMLALARGQSIQCNCGPNNQTPGAPLNPTIQTIHPR